MPMRPLTLRRRPAEDGHRGTATLTAFVLERSPAMRIECAPAERAWMTGTPERFAYRCLPLLIANQAGWLIRNPYPIRATWNGSDGVDCISIEPLGEQLPNVRSHFGSGVLTWTLPYLFRTSPGYNLHVRGPANHPKDGATALEGIVESDWSPATFTMNWKLTRPGLSVVFEADEPICMIAPQRRGELESVRPSMGHLLSAPALAVSHARWSEGRAAFLRALREPGSEAQQRGWQRDYLLGALPNGSRAADHQTKLNLQSFADDESG